MGRGCVTLCVNLRSAPPQMQWSVAAARSPEGMPLNFKDATIDIWDMPMMEVNNGTRKRRCWMLLYIRVVGNCCITAIIFSPSTLVAAANGLCTYLHAGRFLRLVCMSAIVLRRCRQPNAAEIARLLHELLPLLQDKAAVNVALEQPVGSPPTPSCDQV